MSPDARDAAETRYEELRDDAEGHGMPRSDSDYFADLAEARRDRWGGA